LTAKKRPAELPAAAPATSLAKPDIVRRPKFCAVVEASNDERTIGNCLSRLQPTVDAIYCLANGSIDRTRSVAKDYGAVLDKTPMSLPTESWLLYLRADEIANEEQLGQLPPILASASGDVAGIALQTEFFGPDGSPVHRQPDIRLLSARTVD